MTSIELQENINQIPIYLKESSRLYVLVTDLQGIYAYVNPYFQTKFDFVTDDFIGKPVTYATHLNDIVKCEEAVYKLHSNPHSHVQTVVRKPSDTKGNFFYSEWQFSFLWGKNGAPVGVLCVGNDITEVEVVKEQKEIAEFANKTKSAFISNMSHEIRTPLNAVIGFSHLLQKTDLSEEQQEYVETLNFSANLLLGLVNDVLDFSKIESGKMNLSLSKDDIGKLISDLVNVMRISAQQNHDTITVNIDPNLPKFLLLDSIRFKQILVNLLNNAIKFTQNGVIDIGVTIIAKLEDSYQLKFWVKDTGKGIDKSKIDSIFLDFTQEDSSTFKKYGGTGLGLSITNKLLKLMGSEGLHVESELGLGSTFSFYINLHIPEINDENGESEAGLSRESDFKFTVLIVDDNAVNLLLADKLISKKFKLAKIIKANSGKNAIEVLDTLKVDIILMDVYMPEMDGYSCAKMIRKNPLWSKIPIVAVTASDTSEERIKCEEEQMSGFLSKPLKDDLLFDCISNLVI